MTEIQQLIANYQKWGGVPPTVSHRGRGFARFENSSAAITGALDACVHALEIDIRRTADGVIIVHHDASVAEHYGSRQLLRNSPLAELQTSRDAEGGRLPLLRDVLREFSRSPAPTTLLLDIKEAGYEEDILTLTMEAGVNNRVLYVSWLPGVLFAICRADSKAVPVFSHYPVAQRWKFTLLQRLYAMRPVRIAAAWTATLGGAALEPESTAVYFNEYNAFAAGACVTAQNVTDEAHFVHPHVTGELLALLRERKGWVCVHWRQCSNELSGYYHNHGITVSVYSTTTAKTTGECFTERGADCVLADRAKLVTRY